MIAAWYGVDSNPTANIIAEHCKTQCAATMRSGGITILFTRNQTPIVSMAMTTITARKICIFIWGFL